MEKSNLTEWLVDFNGKKIKVTNWWNWKMETTADLFIDDEHIDKNTAIKANPNIPILAKKEFSEDIKSIEVFATGVFKVKILIMVNEENIYQDKLSMMDRLANTVLPKKYTA